MPGVHMLHLTDEATPAIEGTETVRLPWDGKYPQVLRARHLERIHGEVMVIEPDFIVQADLSPVWAFRFDVALCRRHYPIIGPDGRDVTQVMPFNGGLFWARSQAWKRDYLDFCEENKGQFGWYVDQMAMAYLAGHDVLQLNCENFNHTPSPGEDVSKKYALHFKGKRKQAMLNYAMEHGYCE